MKLYYAPGACSLAPHIAAREAGLAISLEKVDLGSKKTAGGEDYGTVNPKGYVPALRLDDGAVLTEAAAILQYLGDREPEAGLLAPPGALERYRVVEWLAYLATEVHKGFSPLWHRKTPEDAKREARERLAGRLQLVEKALATGPFLCGERFTVADPYLFTLANWARPTGFDLSPFPRLQDYHERVGQRPKVREALQAEGLA